MTTYRAVVKHPIDATEQDRIHALVEGIEECAMELVGELGRDAAFIERVLEDAQSAAEYEIETKRHHEEKEKADA